MTEHLTTDDTPQSLKMKVFDTEFDAEVPASKALREMEQHMAE